MQKLFDRFLKTHQARLKPSTWRDYRSILLNHISHFQTFEDLNRDLEDYLAALEVSGKRRNNILSCARTFAAWARRRELWEGRIIKVPRFPHRSKKTKPLSPDEAELVMRFSPQPYKWFFQISILTGLRTGEARGLRFEDFDQKERVIYIRRAISGGIEGTTKTRAGEREVPFLRPVWEIYEKRRRGNTRGSPWFFYGTNRGIMSLGAIRKAWKRVLEAFEIEARPLYATRHTFASLAVAAGEDPLWIAKVMGHERPDQLYLHYASFLEGVKPDGEKFLNMVIGKPSFMRVVE